MICAGAASPAGRTRSLLHAGPPSELERPTRDPKLDGGCGSVRRGEPSLLRLALDGRLLPTLVAPSSVVRFCLTDGDISDGVCGSFLPPPGAADALCHRLLVAIWAACGRGEEEPSASGGLRVADAGGVSLALAVRTGKRRSCAGDF